MTVNQVNAQRAAQERDANIERARNNRVTEKETQRANKASEAIRNEQNRIKKMEVVGKTVNDAFGNIVGGAKAIGTFNDPAWYNLNKDQVDGAATLSYKTPLMGGISPISIATSAGTYRSNVMTLRFIPSVGINATGTPGAPGKNYSLAQQCAQLTYAWVRYANSGAANYEPVDLMMYLLAMDAAYITYAWGRSIYRLANSIDNESLYLVKDIADQWNVNLDDFRANLAQFRTYLNVAATRLNVFAVPRNFSYFNRHIWMVSNIFKDTETRKSNYYTFCPDKFGVYSPAQGRIKMLSLSELNLGAIITYQDFRTLMETVLNPLETDVDIGNINGDIRKEYGDMLFNIESTPAEDRIAPFYSEEVLTQINGATLVGSITNGTADICQYQSNIYQGTYVEGTDSPSTVQYFPNIESNEGSKYIRLTHIVNMYKDDVHPDDNMVATRLMASYGFNEDNQTVTRLVVLSGSEFITTATITYYYDGSNTATKVALYDYSLRSGMPVVAAWLTYDWAPHVVWNPDSAGTTTYYYFANDLDNFAIIDNPTLMTMHNVAMMSLFYLPQSGRRSGK